MASHGVGIIVAATSRASGGGVESRVVVLVVLFAAVLIVRHLRHAGSKREGFKQSSLAVSEIRAPGIPQGNTVEPGGPATSGVQMSLATQLNALIVDAPRKTQKTMPRAVQRLEQEILQGEVVKYLLLTEAIAGDPSFLVVTDRRVIMALAINSVDVDYSQLEAVDFTDRYFNSGSNGFRLVIQRGTDRYPILGKDLATGQTVANYLKSRIGGAAEAAEMKICPRCAEEVKAAAVVCRYCNHEFSNSPA